MAAYSFFVHKKPNLSQIKQESKPEVTNMRPAKEFRAAPEAFRRDQQS